MSTPTDVRKAIKSGNTGPLYLLEGDDLQSRHDLALEFANLVDEGLQAFNVQTFYANEATNAAARDQLIGAILSSARTLPMMSDRRVVIVHESDRLLAPKRGKDDEELLPDLGMPRKAKRGATPAEELEEYVQKPEPMTTMVFVSGPLDANRRIVKLLRKHADVVDCGSLESPREAASWIQKRLEKDELTIDPKAVTLLLNTTGLSLARIRAEIEKLVLYVAGETTITPQHVKDLVIPQNESEGVFELIDAVRNGNAAKALREIAALIDGGEPPFVVLGKLRAAAIQLRPDVRVRNGLEAVLRTDVAIKSSAGAPQHLLECLAVELCARESKGLRQ
jgi:DNA polymerase III delta subunit